MPITYTADINITGVCAFAFSENEKECTLLLPRTNDSQAKFGDLAAYERPDPHVPTLVCLLDHVVTGTDEATGAERTSIPYNVQPDKDGHALAVFNIADMDLTLKTDHSGGLTRKRVGDTSDFDHTIPLLEVNPGSTFKPECFQEDLSTSPVVTRLAFDQGLLFTRALAQEKDGQVWCEFRPLDEAHGNVSSLPRRRIADFTTLRLDGLRADLIFVNKVGERITLGDPKGGQVLLSLTNFDHQPDNPSERRILDYLWYYNLIALPGPSTGSRTLTLPWKYYETATFLTPSSSACPPGEGTRGGAIAQAILNREETRVALQRSVQSAAAEAGKSFETDPVQRETLLDARFLPARQGHLLVKLSSNLVSRAEVFQGAPDLDNLFPHCVSFGVPGARDRTAILWNGAVIITAAHNVGENPDPRQVYEIGVAGGQGPTRKIMTVAGAVRHPGFRRGSHCNDVAVLLLEELVNIDPVPVLSTQDLEVDTEAWVAGFGEDTSGDGSPSGRQFGPVIIRDLNYTQDSLPPCPNREELLIEPTGAAPCLGDSGAPVYVADREGLKLAAMVSRYVSSASCSLQPAICVRLDSRYKDWINRSVEELIAKHGAPRRSSRA